MTTRDDVDELRVLIFAPVGRDAALTSELLARASIPCHGCGSLRDLCTEIERGGGAVLLTEEALDHPDLPRVATTLGQQPAWSDISVLLFAGGERVRASLRTLRLLEMLRNVTLLDRPVRVAAVVSTVRAALRARQRQYDLRRVLVELQAARNEAEQANRLKDEFLATLSHELRTPLNAILGWMAMLRHKQVDPQRVERVLSVVERNAQAQAQLVNDVLDVSRMVTGRLTLARTPVQVSDIILNAVDSAKPSADARRIAIEVDLSADLPPIFGDAERLQQVLWNLLSNAVKFTPELGRITVRAQRDGSQVQLTVTDTGAGLTAEFLPFAFERFRQGDQSFTRAHGGLGLGLAIVKHLVEMHGGDVSVESAGPGQGATFRVRLPVLGPTEEHETVRADQGAESDMPPWVDADFSGRLILVVDDDVSTRELLTMLLTRCQARVVAAASARAAFETVQREVPALVVADIGMPDEDGLSLMRRIRALPVGAGGDVPSLALSAYARGQDKERAREAGFDDFLTKPAVPGDVVTAVKRLLPHASGAAAPRGALESM
jgi:signal transduction histidine kinase/ActR/RegA family two-component response regulator